MSDPEVQPVAPRPADQEAIEEVWKAEAGERRTRLMWTVLILFIVSLVYRVLFAGEFGQSAAMFIGIPAVLAIGLSYTPRARTVTGSIMRGITFFLLLFGILLIEGLVCLLIASPLFYVIGLVIGICADRRRVQRDLNRLRCVAALVFGFMALEGIVMSFEREEEVVIEREVTGNLEEVRGKVLREPELALERLPLFLRIGFPLPESIDPVGQNGWVIRFDEGRDEPTELQVAWQEEDGGALRFVMGGDGTKIGEWLTWRDGFWEFEETEQGTVRASLTVRYRRDLDPAWYFGPVERFGVRKAAGYFADELLRGSGDGQ